MSWGEWCVPDNPEKRAAGVRGKKRPRKLSDAEETRTLGQPFGENSSLIAGEGRIERCVIQV